MLAGRPDRIAEFFGSRLTPGLVRDQLAEARRRRRDRRCTTPAAAGETAARGLFGGPNSAERDKLAVALQRRFEQVYPKRAP